MYYSCWLYNSDKYCDLPLGLFLVRGDSIVLFGDLFDEESEKITRVSPEEIAGLISSGTKKEEWDFD